MIRYCLAAAALGIGWFVVLLIPGTTRGWLLADVPLNLACLVAASVIVAVVFHGFIARAETIGDQFIRAVVIPYVGCVVFLTLFAAQLWIRSVLYGGLANLHDTASLFLFGLMAAVVSCFVVIPYGWLCQYVMQSVSARSVEWP